ncbi:MAG: GWxTD domain-containing protein [Bacteroidetes bacterium]|nr:GWxTD domain-containing protein [Bacteroidota bacterium]MBU1578023.1 GWxTD domain-containing protein [Bacteroidota bacterium]MBU2465064.1 GWxTD domain-containing protein [Bacteroidota bacterium]MBU2556327.1 GWxTD domain-containing protein [Bacteroidota bacterium]
MNKVFIFLALFLLSLSSSFAAPKSMRAYLSYATFNAPDGEPYIETYLAVDGNSVFFKESDPGSFRASLEIIMIFKQADSVVDYAKYALHSQLVQDTSQIDFGFIDQQRFALPRGEYTFELSIADINNPSEPPFIATETILLDFPKDKISLSGIQLIESYEKTDKTSVLTKNGFDLVPMVYAFYPESMNLITFYAEVYNTTKQFGADGKFLLNYYLESYESGKIMDNFLFRKRLDAKEVNVVFTAIEISELPSGNYSLVMEIRDRENKIVADNRVFLRRSNPKQQLKMNDLSSVNINNTFVDKLAGGDTLRDFLKSLEPISAEAERDYMFNLTETADEEMMKKFFYNFWLTRNYGDPEDAWRQYHYEVKKVNAAYKTPTKRGYATDRGRVYLKYGPPNHMMESYNEPGAYPYEIWQYYTLGNQRNKRFVFTTKDMVTNDFVLIHSDALGELANYRWQLDIYKRTWDPNSIDETAPQETWGNEASRNYSQPR